jgi:predicted transglutaminase-like cysteine proteinase
MHKYIWAIAAVSVLAPTLTCAQTRESTLSEPAIMRLGAPVAPPTGFTEMCLRHPQECVSDPMRASSAQLAAVRTWASHSLWAAVFNKDQPVAMEAPASVVHPVGLTARIIAGRTRFWVAEDEQTTPDSDQLIIVSERPLFEDVASRSPTPMARLDMRDINRINTDVNRSIRSGRDIDLFDKDDFWATPSEGRGRGDCEDFVLAKRTALMRAGVSDKALSIALVRTRRGEMHAVLLVATPSGEMVLDNLSPWVVPWNAAPYEWLERQKAGSPSEWVSVPRPERPSKTRRSRFTVD